jgi:hypothetical protein
MDYGTDGTRGKPEADCGWWVIRSTQPVGSEFENPDSVIVEFKESEGGGSNVLYEKKIGIPTALA